MEKVATKDHLKSKMRDFVRWTLQNWFVVVFLFCVVLVLRPLIIDSVEGSLESISRVITILRILK